MRSNDRAMNYGPSEQTGELSDEELDNVVGGAPIAFMEQEGLVLKKRTPLNDGVVILTSSLPGGG